MNAGSCRALLCALLGLAGASFSATLAAQPAEPPARVQLTYDRAPAASGCLAPEQLIDAVEARLGRRVFVPDQSADLFAEVRAFRRARRYVISVTLFDTTGRRLGERRLETRARHCSALDDSLALVLSLAADVRRPSTEGSRLAPAEPAPAPAGRAISTPVTIPAATHAPRAGIRLQPGLGLAFGVGVLPRLALGAQARLGLVAAGFWPIALHATLWHPQRLGAEQGVRFTLQTLQLGLCPWQVSTAGLELSFCLEELVGLAVAQGFGFDDTDAADSWLAAVGGGASARYAAGPVFVAAAASLLVPLIQRRYFYTDGDEVTLHEGSWSFGLFAISAGLEI